METGPDPVVDIKEKAPPIGDYPLYLDVVKLLLIERAPPPELRSKLLSALNDVLQGHGQANLMGWDLVPTLLQVPGSDSCLITIARLANPREVIIGVLEELSQLDLDGMEDDWTSNEATVGEEVVPAEPSAIDRFCFLLTLLSIIQPRIKTQHPSRFLATTIDTITNAFHPSHRAVLAVVKFVNSVSGKKRPTLPGRKSSLSITNVMEHELESPSSLPAAPDPEPQEEDSYESTLQRKLLQGLVAEILDLYITLHPIEWSARLQELFDPKKVVAGRTSLCEAFRKDPLFQIRDTVTGQLVVSS